MAGVKATGATKAIRASRPHRRPQRLKLASALFLTLYLLFILVPLLVLLVRSFTNIWPWPEIIPELLSADAYGEIFGPRSQFPGVLAQTLVIAIATSFLAVLVATLAARALALYDFAGREVFRFGTILPFLIPQTVFAMGIQVLFLKVGLTSNMTGVIIAHSILALPYATAIMVDVTEAVGKRLEEQAQVLGANSPRMLLHVTLPSLLPGLMSAATLSYLISLGCYFVTLLIGGGKVNTVVMMIFPFLTSSDRTLGSAYVVVFLVASLAIFLLFELILKRLGVREQKGLFL
jgi:putative spermidine/putrescine transport system permease protein